MADARDQGGRGGGLAERSGENRCPHSFYSEHWLERRLRALYQSVVAGPVPKELLGIVARIAEPDPLTTASVSARLDRPRDRVDEALEARSQMPGEGRRSQDAGGVHE
jgi:hypothetical protein